MTKAGAVVESEDRKQRASHLQWVRISEMRVSPKAQREYRPSHAEEFAADFDFEAIGFPVVNKRDGHYWIVDGQHRVGALKLVGWGDQQIQCEVYEGLTEAEEADLFLRRDKRRAIRPFDKFRIGITAGRDEESDINRIVMGAGLRVSTDGDEKSISAIQSLRRVYQNGGAAVLARTVRLLDSGFPGDVAKFRSELIAGVGLVCQRYNGALDDAAAAQRLSGLRGGALELVRLANGYRYKTGHRRDDCVAAAFVDVVNAGRGGKKLSSWWS